MKKFHIGLASLAATALILTGCSSDPDDSSQSEVNQKSPTSTEGNTPESNEPAESLGTVRVNQAVTYSITELRNCEPLNDGTIERELELQGFGQYEGERIQIDVYKQMVAGNAGNDVSWSGPEGVFGSSTVATITWGPDGASVLGSSELVDSMTQTERLMISFDLQVPTETVACR